MKNLKSFNERYTRTIGFRYSEPKIEMELTAIFNDDLQKELLQEAFDEFDIKIGNIEVSNDFSELNIDEECDGWFTINFFVYNERKDDMTALIEDIEDFLANKGFLIKVIAFNKK
jgi:hypothetical protein